jgi:hypothetical protein
VGRHALELALNRLGALLAYILAPAAPYPVSRDHSRGDGRLTLGELALHLPPIVQLLL